MEANRTFGKSASGGKGANSRRTQVLIAAVFAIAAAALIYLFVTNYQKKTPAVVAPQNTTVLVAKQYIPAGTSQNQLAAGGLLKPTQVPVSQAVVGALSDPSVVAGQATSVAIEAGQQVTVGDFTKTPANTITGYITGDQRGVGFTFDSEHGLTGYLQPNDTVDIMLVRPGGTVELLEKDVTIIANTGGLLILRLTDKQALLVTSASAKGQMWLTMRPTIKATNSIPVGEVGSAS